MARPQKPEDLFPRVREARELLRQRANEIIERYLALADKAMAAQDFETAEKALRWLAEHMPADADGVRLVDQSVDKVEKKAQQSGPQINIGFAIGGTKKPVELPPAVIDVTPDEP